VLDEGVYSRLFLQVVVVGLRSLGGGVRRHVREDDVGVAAVVLVMRRRRRRRGRRGECQGQDEIEKKHDG